MANTCQGGRLDLTKVQERARDAFLTILNDIAGTKMIIWDESLVGPICHIVKNSLLKERFVMQMFSLADSNVQNVMDKFNEDNLIFITRPRLRLMSNIVSMFQAAESKFRAGSKRQCYILFVPKKTQMCQRHLSSILGSLTLIDLPIYFYPIENDLLSLEQNIGFYEFYADKDPTGLQYIAESILHIQSIYGPIPKFYGKGDAAKVVLDNFKKYRSEHQTNYESQRPQISYMLLIDRSVDLISPLATQLTYEGLIDELFGIKNSQAKFPAEHFLKVEGEQDHQRLGLGTAEPKIILLNSSDELYSELRDKNFNAIGSILRKHAHNTQAQIDERCTPRASVEEMQKFVRHLPQIQAIKRSLAIHTTIAELIKKHTNEESFLNNLRLEQEMLGKREAENGLFNKIVALISDKPPLAEVLRLICLQSLTSGGLKSKTAEHYLKYLVQVYGIKSLSVFQKLRSAGELSIQGSSTSPSYNTMLKIHRLFIDDDSEIDPRDICYVHSVYAPLSVRIVELLPQWSTNHPGLTCLPGPTILMPNFSQQTQVSESNDKESKPSEQRRLVVVYFLGGCTFAEIAALRFLANKDDSTTDYVIATTKIINKKTFLNSFLADEQSNEDTF